MTFAERYGPWAVVAGASEGLGAAFATELAERGVKLVLVARRAAPLEEMAEKLRAKVEVRTIVGDVAELDWGAIDVDVGLAVYNAAFSVVGPFADRPLDDALRVVDVNVRGPVRFARALGPAMLARGKGGLVLMSSLAGFQGGPRLAAYASSKAFLIVLGESLWAEWRPRGVDVVVSCPGAVRTPNYAQAAAKEAPGTLDAAVVARTTLDALGHGPLVVPGAVNRLARFVLGRVLTRAAAVGVMERNTADLA